MYMRYFALGDVMRKIILFSLLLAFLSSGVSTAALVDNFDETVTDTTTGLMWQKATAPGTYTWQQALAYAQGLSLAGQTDWRLPNRNELQSLVDYSRTNPSIDPLLIPNTVSCAYWSSTTYTNYALNTDLAWLVHFYHGFIVSVGKSSGYYVRAVRGGQSGLLGNFKLTLPIASDNPSLALSGRSGGAGSGRVTSWFDHAYPNYNDDNKLTRWDGAPEFSNASIDRCKQGESCYAGHNGIDFSKNPDSAIVNEVYAAAPGTAFGIVSGCKEGFTDCGGKYGNQVWINHGNGYATRYAHLKENQVFVTDGQYIGEPLCLPLGIMGNTGKSGGTHLHFSVYFDQKNDGWSSNEVIDPYGWRGSGTDPCSVDNTCVAGRSEWMWNYPQMTQRVVPPSVVVTAATPSGSANVMIPAASVTTAVHLELQDVPAGGQSAAGFFSAARSFVMKVLEWATGGSNSFQPSRLANGTLAEGTGNSFAAPVTVTIGYTAEEIKHLNENQLTIFRWNETTNQYVPLVTQVDAVLKKASAQTTEAGRFDLKAPLLCTGDVNEPNDNDGAATRIATNGSLQVERFDIAEDEDWFTFNALSRNRHVIQLKELAAGVGAVVRLYDSDGTTVLATATATDSTPAELIWRAAHGGVYYLRISMSGSSAFGCSSTYKIGVMQSATSLPVSVPSILQLLLN